MNAIDTNVLVRMLVEDEPKQAALALAIFGGPVWIAKTVLLETSWVLRSAYGLTDEVIGQAFAKVLGLAGVQVEDELAVAAALALTKLGLQFADALHLHSRPPEAQFVTFDRSLVRRAKRAGVSKIGAAGEPKFVRSARGSKL